MSKKLKKVVVAMSGGVDSSVSAYLLKQQNYHVEGLFMKNWEEDDGEKYCGATIDLADTKEVCNKINIKLHTVNFAAEYWDNVFVHFLAEYRAGRTPNPDILCNKEIKFKVFLDFAFKYLGADYIATGHYVRRKKNTNGKNQLLRGLDENKDQSYFLHTISHKQITKCIFPVGELKKIEVRNIAKDLGFINANKKGSTGICFIGKRNFNKFISCYLPNKPGKITTINGEIVGEHQGLMYYTIGQRKGLGIGGISRNNESKPWYVVDKDINKNVLVIAQGRNHPCLMSVGLVVQKLHLVDREPIVGRLRCTMKTRYRQVDIPCTVDATSTKNIKIYSDKKISAVTPGQSVVLYNNNICLGGGVIEKRLPCSFD